MNNIFTFFHISCIWVWIKIPNTTNSILGTLTNSGAYSLALPLPDKLYLCKVLLKVNGPFIIPVPNKQDSNIEFLKITFALDSSIWSWINLFNCLAAI